MRRVLITGGSGFIGYHLVRRLVGENYDIRCLVRPTSTTNLLKPFDVEFHDGDIFDPASLEKAVLDCDTIFNLAGRVRARDLAQFLETNRDGTRNLVQAAASQPNPPVFVQVSSLAVMGPAPKNRPKTETDLPMPISDYGRSKLEGERTLLPFADEMPCSIVRPGIVFGEADKMNLELFKTVRKLGVIPNPGWTTKSYSWIHAADLAELLLLVARKGARINASSEESLPDSKGVYLASAGDGFSLSEIGREIGRALDRKRTEAVKVPPVGVWGVASFFEFLQRTTGKPQPYDWAKARESLHSWCGSPKKAETELGFSPLADISERFDQTAQWYEENGWL